MMNFQPQCKDSGYKEVIEYLNNNIDKEEMIEKIKMETRRYAKRQITWFKKNESAIWLDGKADINENTTKILRSNLIFLGGYNSWL